MKTTAFGNVRGVWGLFQRAGLVLLVGALMVFAVASLAQASGPSSGSEVSDAVQPQAGFTANTPFSSGQQVNVVIPANSLFSPTVNLQVLECSAPGGQIPTNPASCDFNTSNPVTIKPNSDGSVNYQESKSNGTHALFTLYALPDSISLEESDSPGAPTCNLTVQCILYVGDNFNDFTKPHVWSTPFYIAPNSDDKGENPGDGSAPAPPATPDPGTSTLTSTRTTATADGVDSVTVTATLLSSNSVPVQGKTVVLSQGSGHSSISPASMSTNSSGQATFTVTDATPETVTYAAQDTTDTVGVTQTLTVDFQTPAVQNSTSTVIASPTSVPNPGDKTTITVTLRDQAQNPQPVAGQTVTLSATKSAVVTPLSTPAGITNAQGQVTFTATDAVTESSTFTATVTSDGNLVLSDQPTVSFGTVSVSGSTSTVTAGTPAPVGGIGTDATVTLLTTNGSPVSGKAVTLTASSPTAVVTATQGTTGANGQATFTVTDSAAESVTLTARDTTDSVTLSQTPTVDFEASSPSASKSTITTNATTEPADGESQALITVTINDQFGSAETGKTVTLAESPAGSGVLVHPIAVGGNSSPGITNKDGVVEFEADNTQSGMVTFSATDTTDNFTLSNTVTVTYIAGTADSDVSTVAANPAQVPSDGTTASTVTVTLTDYFGNGIAGKTISLQALNGHSVVGGSSTAPVTNASGVATFSVTDTTAEVVTYQATDVTDGNLVLAQEAVVTFGNPPAPPPDPNSSSISASALTVPADGATTSTISVRLYDADGDPVPGKTVTLSASQGSSKVTAVNGTSTNAGIAQFTVSDATPESVTYSAVDGTDGVTLNETVTIAFTSSGTTTTTTTAPGSTTTTTAGGSATTTTTTSPSGSTTTTTTGAGDGSTTTTTTTTASTSSDEGNSDAAVSLSPSSSGDNDSSGGGSSLAFTGLSQVTPWLASFGLLLLIVGTVGRRRYRSAADQKESPQ